MKSTPGLSVLHLPAVLQSSQLPPPSTLYTSKQAIRHIYVYTCVCVCVCVCVRAMLSLVFCDPMDCKLPGSSVHGILQARTLEWVAIPFSRGCFCPLFYLSYFSPSSGTDIFLRSKLITQKNHTSSLPNVSFISKKKLLYWWKAWNFDQVESYKEM